MKKALSIAVTHKLFYQDSLASVSEDEFDGRTLSQRTHGYIRQEKMNKMRIFYNNIIRSRHPSSDNSYVTKIVELDKKKLKERRFDRFNIRVKKKGVDLITYFRDNVTVADLTVHHDREYFADFVTLRSQNNRKSCLNQTNCSGQKCLCG